jgi:hypothetical protein
MSIPSMGEAAESRRRLTAHARSAAEPCEGGDVALRHQPVRDVHRLGLRPWPDAVGGERSGLARVTSCFARVTSRFVRVTSGFARVSSGFARVTSGFARVSSGFARVTSGFARVTSGLRRVTSGFARVISGVARVTSGFAHVASGLRTRDLSLRTHGLRFRTRGLRLRTRGLILDPSVNNEPSFSGPKVHLATHSSRKSLKIRSASLLRCSALRQEARKA